MKKQVIYGLAVLAATSLVAGSAFAVELSETKRASIVDNCSVLKSDLPAVGQADATTRVNRGYNYDQAQKLFLSMNARVANNNITEPKLTEITKNFEKELAGFRAGYSTYANQLKRLESTNCEHNPENFYDELEKLREARQAVGEKVKRLDALLQEYQIALGGLFDEEA